MSADPLRDGLAVIFDDIGADGKLPQIVNYRIRQNATYVTSTKGITSTFLFSGPRDWDDTYYTYGFLFIQVFDFTVRIGQDIIERSIVQHLSGLDIMEPGLYMQEMPFPCFHYDR